MVEVNSYSRNDQRIRECLVNKSGFVQVGATMGADGRVLDRIFVNPAYFESRGLATPEQLPPQTKHLMLRLWLQEAFWNSLNLLKAQPAMALMVLAGLILILSVLYHCLADVALLLKSAFSRDAPRATTGTHRNAI